jgi:hypothetical protein
MKTWNFSHESQRLHTTGHDKSDIEREKRWLLHHLALFNQSWVWYVTTHSCLSESCSSSMFAVCSWCGCGNIRIYQPAVSTGVRGFGWWWWWFNTSLSLGCKLSWNVVIWEQKRWGTVNVDGKNNHLLPIVYEKATTTSTSCCCWNMDR